MIRRDSVRAPGCCLISVNRRCPVSAISHVDASRAGWLRPTRVDMVSMRLARPARMNETMLQFQLSQRPTSDAEIVRFWALADGTRCVLTTTHDSLELRLANGTRLLRRAPYRDFSHARAAAMSWRVEYEIQCGVRNQRRAMRACPECGEDTPLEARAAGSSPWLECRSCGNTWVPANLDPRDTDGR